MLNTRIIPILLLKNGGLVKIIKFSKPQYLGDPINAIKIFNDKGIDELILLDIDATIKKNEPDYKLLEKISSECFMPLCYGGGITKIEQIRRIINIGIEKISLNTYAYINNGFVKECSELFGSQSIVVSIDVKKKLFND